MKPPKKKHLIQNRDESHSLCGLRISRRFCTTVTDYKDWGFDGDIKDLCSRCQDKFDAECNFFTKACRNAAIGSASRLKSHLSK